MRSLHCDFNDVMTIEPTDAQTGLDDLSLSHNRIIEVPEAFAGRLRCAALAFNCLQRVSVAIFVESIRAINMCQNELRWIPSEFFKLPRLTSLILFKNRIESVPTEFSTSGLELFDLSENPVSALPVIPFSLRTLKVNFCGISDFSGIVPPRNELRAFHACGNGMERLPPLPVIEELLVAGNNLKTIPLFEGSIVAPFLFDLSCNALTELPPVSALFRMFDASENQLTKVRDEYFENRSRLALSCNPIDEVLSGSALSCIESIDVVNTGIRLPELGSSVKEALANFEGKEPRDVRSLYIDCGRAVGYAEMLGLRAEMEDAIIVRQKAGIYGVFDGHSGTLAARYAAASFAPLFMEGPITPAIVLTKLWLFQETLISANETSGTTMDLVFLEGSRALVAHLGDGKVAIFDDEGRLTFETEEHTPTLRREFERLRDQKVAISKQRTAGILAMSRSLGDPDVKGMSQVPDFHEIVLAERDRWVVIACDGLWDDIDNESAAKTLLRSRSPGEAARLLRDQAFSRGSEDNISVIVIDRKMLS
jgi:serine/threonine protein phosphatase PrpC/Leucine-rich repeat (LRR) protein